MFKMATNQRKSHNQKKQKGKTIDKYENKPAEWYLNVIKACQYLQGGVTIVPFPIRHFHYPYPNHIPHLSIKKIIDIGVDELDISEDFYKKHCMQCKHSEVICIIENDYLNNIMRYEQLKTCINANTNMNKKE